MNERSQTNKISQTRITDHIESKIGKYQHEMIGEYGDKMEKRRKVWLESDSKM